MSCAFTCDADQESVLVQIVSVEKVAQSVCLQFQFEFNLQVGFRFEASCGVVIESAVAPVKGVRYNREDSVLVTWQTFTYKVFVVL